MLERDVRYLDSRIALLIQNRMALDEVSNMKKIGGQLYVFRRYANALSIL